jgi:hypothetical protein
VVAQGVRYNRREIVAHYFLNRIGLRWGKSGLNQFSGHLSTPADYLVLRGLGGRELGYDSEVSVSILKTSRHTHRTCRSD